MSDDDDGPILRTKRKFRSYVSDSLFDSTVDAPTTTELVSKQSPQGGNTPPVNSRDKNDEAEVDESTRPADQIQTQPLLVPRVSTPAVSAAVKDSGCTAKPHAGISHGPVAGSRAPKVNPAAPVTNTGAQVSTVRAPKRRSSPTSSGETTTTATRKRQQLPNRVASPKTSEAKSKRGRPSVKEEPESPATRRKSGSRPKVTKIVSELEVEDAATGGFKAGQRYLCPPVGDGTRAFYESLLKENPSSLLATRYCIEHGVLIGTQHKEQFMKYQILRDSGAFKGTQGGINKRFANGLTNEDIASWNAKKGISPKAKTTKAPVDSTPSTTKASKRQVT